MTKNKMLIAGAVIVIGIGFFSFTAMRSSTKEAGHSHQMASKYYCPMHPQVVSDKPGDCPICNMRLVSADSKIVGHNNKNEKSTGKGKILFYRNPMNAKVHSPVPAKDEMGMDYIPVYENEMKGMEKSEVEGHVGVSIGPEKQQLIGIKISIATRRELKKEITTVGKIAYDPDLYQAESEYLQAVKALQNMKKETGSPLNSWAETLVKSAKTKLILMGLNEEMLESIAKADGPDESLLYAKPGEETCVYANIFEYEISLVKVGQDMEVHAPTAPGVILEGKIMAIDTVVDAMTRSIRVRGKVQNKDGLLKPNMFVNVVIKVDVGTVLAVPEEAVLISGDKARVFVEKQEGYFEPRIVIVGQKADGFYEIIDGLKESEKVVTSGNFFVDSESRLKSALSGFGGDDIQ